jgi:uracil-DNA glycosylase family 4
MADYCEGCPRRGLKTVPGEPGAVGCVGSLNADVLVVGMSPGREEIKAGEPFIGKSGSLLRVHGANAGLFRENCRIANTIKCWPGGGKKGKTLTKTQIKACAPGLERIVAETRAKVILCLGAEAFDAVTGLVTWEKGVEKEKVKGLLYPNGDKMKAKPVGIGQWRGYLVSPESCAPLEREVVRPSQDLYKQAGVCPSCKGGPNVLECDYCKGSGKRVKGQPKLEKVTIEVPRRFPDTVRYIIGTYHPSFIMRSGMKPLPAFVNDVARVMRVARDQVKLLDLNYETSL